MLAGLYARVAPRLFTDLEQAGLLREPPGDDPGLARREWECFALYACVRGLVAAGGFNRETVAAIDALHETALGDWRIEEHAGESAVERRRLIAERYAEYGALGQEGGAAGAAGVGERLGAAAARHMTRREPPPAALAEMAGALHESLVEGAAEAVRSGSDA
jgi:hypothetical protein